MSHRLFRNVFCSTGRNKFLYTSSDHTKLAISTVSTTFVAILVVATFKFLVTAQVMPPAGMFVHFLEA